MIEYSDLQLESTVDPMEEVHISLRLTNLLYLSAFL